MTIQPGSFVFSAENAEKVAAIIAKYPEGRQQSAILPLLDMAQRQHEGWLPRAAMDHVAELLDMAPIRVYEVATFYTMFNLKRGGRHYVQVCTTTPCWLRGSDEVLETCIKHLGIKLGQTTDDGMFTLVEVECLAACVNAPVAQIGDDYFEDLDADSMTRILDGFVAGKQPRPGSQVARQTSAPLSGAKTLTDVEAPAGGKV